MKTFEVFSKLHHQPDPLLLANIWDVSSAKIFEANGYQAIGTSSHAVAKSLGYEDGEKLPFDSLLRLAKRVVECVQIPFTVDMEGGFSRTADGIIKNIEKLHDVGVAGINLEDTVAGTSRKLQSATEFQKILSTVSDHLSRKNIKIFINIRTDGFLLGMSTALEETITRVKIYNDTGAHGIFIPCITKANDIKEVVNVSKLPVNVMCMPGLPGFEELGQLGVKRISMGGFFFDKIYHDVAKLSVAISKEKNFSPIIS